MCEIAFNFFLKLVKIQPDTNWCKTSNHIPLMPRAIVFLFTISICITLPVAKLLIVCISNISNGNASLPTYIWQQELPYKFLFISIVLKYV